MDTKRVRELMHEIDNLNCAIAYVRANTMINYSCHRNGINLENVLAPIEDVIESLAVKELERLIALARHELRTQVATLLDEGGAP